jgi:hypothetical protein
MNVQLNIYDRVASIVTLLPENSLLLVVCQIVSMHTSAYVCMLNGE